MASSKNLSIDYKMMGIWLRTSPELREHLMDLGEKGVEYAKSVAPVGEAPHDKHSGAYRDSLNYEIHQSPSRMSLRVGARDQKAHWIEFGAKHMPVFGVLGKTLDYLKGLL